MTIANYLEGIKIPVTAPDAVMVKLNFIRSGKDVLAGQRNSLPGTSVLKIPDRTKGKTTIPHYS
jgi:hypothetical protein